MTNTKMPMGNLPGWKQTVAEDFLGTSMPSNWYIYEGAPGGTSTAWWLPSHVSIRDSILNLRTSGPTVLPNGNTGYISGGCGCEVTQKYGKYEVRMRSDAATGISTIALLWPNPKLSPPWPQGCEVDFREGYGPTITATLHYDVTNQTIQRVSPTYDFRRWHTVGVEWTPNKLEYTIDGKVWGTVVGAIVPSDYMNLDLQSQYVGDMVVEPPQSDYQIDWVVMYEMSS